MQNVLATGHRYRQLRGIPRFNLDGLRRFPAGQLEHNSMIPAERSGIVAGVVPRGFPSIVMRAPGGSLLIDSDPVTATSRSSMYCEVWTPAVIVSGINAARPCRPAPRERAPPQAGAPSPASRPDLCRRRSPARLADATGRPARLRLPVWPHCRASIATRSRRAARQLRRQSRQAATCCARARARPAAHRRLPEPLLRRCGVRHGPQGHRFRDRLALPTRLLRWTPRDTEFRLFRRQEARQVRTTRPAPRLRAEHRVRLPVPGSAAPVPLPPPAWVPARAPARASLGTQASTMRFAPQSDHFFDHG